jgi:hypothetical protein
LSHEYSHRGYINSSKVLSVHSFFFIAIGPSNGLSDLYVYYLSQMIWILQIINYSLLFKIYMVCYHDINQQTGIVILIRDLTIFTKLYINNNFCSSNNFTLCCRKLILQSRHKMCIFL